MSNAKFIYGIKDRERPSGANSLGARLLPGPVMPIEKQPAAMSQVRLNRVIAFIESHLASDLCVSILATVAGMSPYYFCRSFKQTTGTTPHRYVISRRMEQAKVLLEKNGASLLQIAQQVGFADQSQFTRVFHKVVGLTPAQFRKSG